MGGNKPFICYRGRTLLEWSWQLAQDFTATHSLSPPCLITHGPNLSGQLLSSYPVIDDSQIGPHRGPLQGILAGLHACQEQGQDWLLVLPVDMPLLQTQDLEHLKLQPDHWAIIPVIDGFLQPLVGVYHVAALCSLQEELLRGKASPRRWADQWVNRVSQIGIKDSSRWKNINCGDDLLELASIDSLEPRSGEGHQ